MAWWCSVPQGITVLQLQGPSCDPVTVRTELHVSSLSVSVWVSSDFCPNIPVGGSKTLNFPFGVNECLSILSRVYSHLVPTAVLG